VNTNQSDEADGDVGAPNVSKEVRAPSLSPKEWYSRGYLPHRDAKELLQAVTFRLADSLPQEKLNLLEEELSNLSENQRSIHRRNKIEQWLDAGMGCCALRHPKLTEKMRDALQHFDGQRYRLLAWCIMPNHVHVLMETLSHRPDRTRLEIRHHPLGIVPQRKSKTGHPEPKPTLDAGLLGSIHPQRRTFREYRALHPSKTRQSRPMRTRRGLAMVQRRNAEVLLGIHALLSQRGHWRSHYLAKVLKTFNL
jgi:hypothetical protein